VVVTKADGLLTESAINLDNIQTVQKAKIGSFIAHLSMQRMQEVRRAIDFALGF
jgi:mRNA-degrading endonuclease toxin of MazEF toxin-antitoxin module